MISVVTSTFQRPDKLLKAIKSVQNQTYPDWEMIVVSDGIDSATRAVVEAFRDPKVRYFEIKHFGNHSRPKNKGIMEAKGDYIAFLDDDNQYRPDHLNVLMKGMEREMVDVVYGDRWIIDEDKQFPSQLGVFSDFDQEKIFKSNYIDTSDVLVKKEALFDLGGCDERFKRFCDWNLWVRMVKAGKRFKRVPLVITDYYLSSDSMSQKRLDAGVNNSPAWDPINVEIELPFLGKVPEEPRVAIFSLTYDRLNTTKASFESLYKTAGKAFDHFIYDNGSSDGTQKYLKTLKNPNGNIWVEYSPDNKGISIASNACVKKIQEGKYDIIVKSDSDAIYQTDGWLAKMCEMWRSNHKIAFSCYISGLRDNPGGSMRFAYGTIKNELVGMSRHLGGINHFVDVHAYEGFKWPEDDTLHGMQDLFFSNFLTSRGYQMGYLENYYCNHGIGGTAQQELDYPSYFARRKLEKTIVYGDKKV